jgi:hypothetical protein
MPVSSVLTPRSIPTAVPGRACACGRPHCSSTVKETNQRCAVRLTVADKIRAVPASTREASVLVSSCVRTAPRRGRVTVAPAQRSVPVSRKESLALPFFFHRGNPSLFPLRRPFLDLTKSPSARSRFRNASW